MNRQTLAVTLGTIALVICGAILLYASPTPHGNVATRPSVPVTGKGMGDAGAPGVRPESKLVHMREVPSDRPAAAEGAPNVVLLVWSTQRRDQWTLYDGPAETTPYLVTRAAQGVVFDDALAVAVDPKTAAVALTTGRFPHHMQLVEPAAKRNTRKIPAEAQTLAERLAAGGWHTVGLTANHLLNRSAGQDQGFDFYRDSQPFSFMLDRRIPAHELVDHALQVVERRSEAERARPLYLQLAFADSHKPFRVPPDEFRKFEGPGHSVAPYRAVVRRQDDQVERLVAALAPLGIDATNTVFVVIADHGEGLDMPKHHRRQHGYVLYASSVQIPWVMWGDGVAKGRRIEGLASQIDLVPTVLGLTGLSTEGTDGVDLASAARGEVARTGRTRAYADTLFEGTHRASLWTDTMQCQKDFGSVGVQNSHFENGCFDRGADPEFTKPKGDAMLLGELEAMHNELMADME